MLLMFLKGLRMPTKLTVPESAQYSGINVTWTKSTGKLYIDAWYDSFVGIEGKEFTLREFLEALNITERDCLRAWRRK